MRDELVGFVSSKQSVGCLARSLELCSTVPSIPTTTNSRRTINVRHLVGILFEQQVNHRVATVSQNFKSERQKVVGHTIGRVDLNATQERDSSVPRNERALAQNNLLHELVLRLKERKGQFHHGVGGLRQLIGVRQEHVAHVRLLGVEGIHRHIGLLSPLGDALHVLGGRDAAAAAGTTVRTTPAIHRTDVAPGIDTHVGTVHHQTTASVGNVVGHGTKPSGPAKGKARQTPNVEAVPKGLLQGLFEGSIDFVAAQTGAQQRGLAVAKGRQRGCDLFNQPGVGQGAGKGAGNLGHGSPGRTPLEVGHRRAPVVQDVKPQRQKVVGHALGAC